MSTYRAPIPAREPHRAPIPDLAALLHAGCEVHVIPQRTDYGVMYADVRIIPPAGALRIAREFFERRRIRRVE